MSRTADKAGNDVLVFVHQNVLLHSLTAMIRAAAQLRVGVLGLRGAVGVRGDGRIAGRRRERGALVGVPVQPPADVDSVDGPIFTVPRPAVTRPLQSSRQSIDHPPVPGRFVL